MNAFIGRLMCPSWPGDVLPFIADVWWLPPLLFIGECALVWWLVIELGEWPITDMLAPVGEEKLRPRLRE